MNRSLLLAGAAAVAAVVAAMMMSKKKKRTIIRAALDIGSGEHKMVVATLDARTGAVEDVLHSEVITVLLAMDLKRAGSDGALSPAALAASSAALATFAATAKSYGCGPPRGVATAVFRRASNGEAHLAAMRAEHGVGLAVVTQATEGRLGYLTAVGAAPAGGGPVVSWDSGGGSFQVAAAVGGETVVYEGPLGSADAHAGLRERMRFSGPSPNPADATHVDAVVADLAARMPDVPPWLSAALGASRVVCFGHHSSLFRIVADVAGKRDFGPSDARAALSSILSIGGDAELSAWLASLAASHADLVAPGRAPPSPDAYPEIHLVVPKLCLLIAVMDKLGLDDVHYEETNGSCLGVLLDDATWA